MFNGFQSVSKVESIWPVLSLLSLGQFLNGSEHDGNFTRLLKFERACEALNLLFAGMDTPPKYPLSESKPGGEE